MRTTKVTIQVATLSVFLALFSPVWAAKKGAKNLVAGVNPATGSKLSTNIHFDGATVHGRRQSPFGASAVVELEKETPELVDFRSHYNDRIERSKSGR